MLRIHRTEGSSGETVLELSGTLRAGQVEALRSALEEARGGAPIVLDLGEITYIDRAGAAELRSAGRHVTLTNVPPFIRTVLGRRAPGGER